MNRRTILTAAPAAVIAAAIPSTTSAVTYDIWQRWQEARAAADEAWRIEQAAEAEHGDTAPEYVAVLDWSRGLWLIAFNLSNEALATPCQNAADVVGKARVLAFEFDVDDWGEPETADLIERQMRDLAAAYGVADAVAAIIDPVIAERDRRRERQRAKWEA